MIRCLALLLALPSAARAAASAPVLGTSGGGSVAALLQVVLALAIVLGLIVVGAWLMRRFSLLPRSAQGRLRVVSGVMVGTRERVVIVELNETWLVLGVTSEQVNLLHTLPKPEDAHQPEQAIPPFALWLQQAIVRRKGGVQ
ncbi:flagellar biosynthetic protein FliO [Chitinilyticum piscinae]|uniref:Flagellar protein n=1 Tax=Chitinilyticum piscinae TaxID=2866724 RepID=A0A8J7FNG3_9NEIS|nr:flagellar biosynthetic protein FliO [Chitinilyticum piscinae]MBE9609961.1 flagellar biosynthetic protein FliO [Chitinilyticum piscinae]